MNRNLIVGIASILVLMVGLAWFFRYDVAYLKGWVVVRQDRWTGATEYCEPDGCWNPENRQAEREHQEATAA